jgi:hypothetical protein
VGSVAWRKWGCDPTILPLIAYNASACRSSRIIVQTFVQNAATASCACAGACGPVEGFATNVACVSVRHTGGDVCSQQLLLYSSEYSSAAGAGVCRRRWSFSVPPLHRRRRAPRLRRLLSLNNSTRVAPEQRKAHLAHDASMVQCVAGNTRAPQRCCQQRS